MALTTPPQAIATEGRKVPSARIPVEVVYPDQDVTGLDKCTCEVKSSTKVRAFAVAKRRYFG